MYGDSNAASSLRQAAAVTTSATNTTAMRASVATMNRLKLVEELILIS
jgi:hypothetical protein